MDLCFAEISVAWTQKHQMWGEKKKKKRFWCLFLTQRLYMPVEWCTSWPGWHKAIGRMLVVVYRRSWKRNSLAWGKVYICISLMLCFGWFICWVWGQLCKAVLGSSNISHTTHYPGLDNYLSAGQTAVQSTWQRAIHCVPTTSFCMTTRKLTIIA